MIVAIVWVIYKPTSERPYHRLQRQFVKSSSEDWVSEHIAPHGTFCPITNDPTERCIDREAVEICGAYEKLILLLPQRAVRFADTDPGILETWLE